MQILRPRSNPYRIRNSGGEYRNRCFHKFSGHSDAYVSQLENPCSKWRHRDPVCQLTDDKGGCDQVEWTLEVLESNTCVILHPQFPQVSSPCHLGLNHASGVSGSVPLLSLGTGAKLVIHSRVKQSGPWGHYISLFCFLIFRISGSLPGPARMVGKWRLLGGRNTGLEHWDLLVLKGNSVALLTAWELR